MAHPAILVVDDDQVILQSFARILERHGYDVETAATGHEAIERCKNGSYDVALLDIKLPDMDGTQLLKELGAMRRDDQDHDYGVLQSRQRLTVPVTRGGRVRLETS